jgi:hypothetical protein
MAGLAKRQVLEAQLDRALDRSLKLQVCGLLYGISIRSYAVVYKGGGG